MAGAVNRPDRLESRVQVVILFVVAVTAAAASFTHVHDLADKHGQHGWKAWADAVVLELISIAVALEIRRRRRAKVSPGGFVIGVLAGAAGLSLAAQVATAEQSVWGWIMAALPAAAVLALTKIVLSRPTAVPTVPDGQDEPAATDTVRPVPEVGHGLGEEHAVPPAPDGPRPPVELVPPIPDELLTAAQRVAGQHQQTTGRQITRDELRAVLRVSNGTASDLLRALRDDRPAVPALVPARPNGHPSAARELS